jgi:hypothetical protein
LDPMPIPEEAGHSCIFIIRQYCVEPMLNIYNDNVVL